MIKELILTVVVATLITGCVTTEQVIIGKDSEGNPVYRDVGQIDLEKASKDRINLALRFIQLRQMPEAKANLEIAENYNPGSQDILLAWGRYFSTVGDKVSAEKVYKDAISKYENGVTQTAYGSFLCNSGKYKEADAYFNKATSDPKYQNMSYTYTLAATCSFDSGDKAKAQQYFEKAMNYGGTSPELLFNYASFCNEIGDYVRADHLMQTFDMFNKNSTAQTLMLKIKIAQGLHQDDNVKALGSKLLRLFPKSNEAKNYAAGNF